MEQGVETACLLHQGLEGELLWLHIHGTEDTVPRVTSASQLTVPQVCLVLVSLLGQIPHKEPLKEVGFILAPSLWVQSVHQGQESWWQEPEAGDHVGLLSGSKMLVLGRMAQF